MPAKSSTELFAAAPVTAVLVMGGAAMLRLPEFCYFVTFAVPWTLADLCATRTPSNTSWRSAWAIDARV
jgi:hypothetical protein